MAVDYPAFAVDREGDHSEAVDAPNVMTVLVDLTDQRNLPIRNLTLAPAVRLAL